MENDSPASRLGSRRRNTETAFSATHRDVHDHLSTEDGYLVKWLSSRLEPTTLTLREESALTATAADRRQIARLLKAARARGLSIFPQKKAQVA